MDLSHLGRSFKIPLRYKSGCFILNPTVHSFDGQLQYGGKISNWVTRRFAETVPLRALRSYPSLTHYANHCDHHHGCPFGHSENLGTTFRQAVFSLRRHQTFLQTGGEFQWSRNVSAITANFFAGPIFQLT
jgi:hypothetical protein